MSDIIVVMIAKHGSTFLYDAYKYYPINIYIMEYIAIYMLHFL